MKLKGFVYCKVERIGNEIKRLANHEAFIDRRIKELQEEIVAFERKKKRIVEYKAKLNNHLEKVRPRLVGEKCWARKELNDKINKYSKLVELAMKAFDKETT